MIKSSKNRIILKFICLLLLSVFLDLSASAASKIDYYKRMFKEAFEFKTFESADAASDSIDPVLPAKQGTYVVLMTSDLINPSPLSKYLAIKASVIVICDSEYKSSVPYTFSCNSQNVVSKELVSAGYIYKTPCDTCSKFYVMPEDVLLSPLKREDTIDLFKAFRLSDKASADSEKVKNTLDMDIFKDKLANPIAIDGFLLLILTLVFLSFFFGISTRIRCINLAIPVRQYIPTLLNCLSKFLLDHQQMLLTIVMLMTLIYLPIVVLLGLRDGQGLSLGYFLDYSLETFKPINIVNYIEGQNYIRILLFFYNYFYGSLLILLALPYLISSLVAGLTSLPELKLKKSVKSLVFPVLCLIVFFLLLLLDLTKTYVYVLSLLIIQTWYLFSRVNTTPPFIYTPKFKYYTFALIVLFTLFGFIFKKMQTKSGTSYSFETLIGVSNEIISLPYKKVLYDNLRFKDYFINTDLPVFADKYLVHAPTYRIIRNRPISYFDGATDYIVQSADASRVISELSSNDKFRFAISSTAPSTLFSLSNENQNLSGSLYDMNIGFSCRNVSLEGDKVMAEVMYINDENKIEKKEVTLMYFPGCTYLGIPENHTTEIELPYTDSSSVYVHVTNLVSSDINRITLNQNGIKINPTFYKYSNSVDPLITKITPGLQEGTLTNYIFDNNTFFLDYDMLDSPNDVYNISLPINKLIDEGKLKDTFVIWSTQKYHIIKGGR